MRDVAPGWRLIDGAVAVHQRLRPERLGRARAYTLLVPAFLLVSVLAVGVLYLVWRSFHSFDTFLYEQGPLSTEQYRRLVEAPSGSFNLEVLARTLAVSGLVTIGAVVIGLPLAYFIVRVQSQLVRAVALVLLLAPFLMGEAVRAFGWSLILGKRGALVWLSSLVGIDSGGLMGTTLAIWIGLMQVSIPLAALLILPAVRRIDPSLERAARTLGARPWRIWWHVIAPLARPGIAAGAAIVFLLSVAELDLPQVLGLGQLPFAANVIRGIYTLQNNLNLGSAFSVVLMVIAIAVVVLIVRVGVPRRS